MTINRVLVVDDREENLYLLRALLQGHGFEVVTAVHGAEALDKARQNPPDVIITDILMPVMDGFSLCREWKNDERLKPIPFVFYTATYTDERDREFALSLGAERFIVKPEEPDTFLAIIRETLQHVENSHAVRAKPAADAPGRLPIEAPEEDEAVCLKRYNEALIRKLEAKMEQLEQANRQLEQDIAARRAVEASLRESEERLSLAASAAEAGLWIMNVDRDLMWATQKFRELFQFDLEEELHFERFISAIHPDDRERVRTKISQSLEKREALNLEYRIVRPDGSLRWISSRGNPSFDGSGLPERLMGVAIDVTERKLMEAELRERLDEIERLKRQLENENVYLREEIKTERGFEKIVGRSDALQYVLFKIQQVAPTDATVLILGETGTGKGVVAQAIHEMSARKDKPMITVNCAALPANLIESELFGREKGAFTGAHARQVGRFEIANTGTIFLDEIGEMPLELQAKLLRVLQEGEFERLGSPRTIKVDVRVLASTSRDLKAEVQNRRFREDLYYRLNVFPISIPSLSARAEDIPQLVSYFVDRYARKLGRKYETVSKLTMEALQEHSWPGNVRELEHVIERAVITSPGPVLQLADRVELEAAVTLPLKGLRAVEREHILDVLEKTSWKIDGTSGAATLLGLHPSTLRFRLKKLGIKRP